MRSSPVLVPAFRKPRMRSSLRASKVALATPVIAVRPVSSMRSPLTSRCPSPEMGGVADMLEVSSVVPNKT